MQSDSHDRFFQSSTLQPDKRTERAALSVERAIYELDRGRAVDLVDADEYATVALIEGLLESTFQRLLGTASRFHILLSAERAKALGLGTGELPLELLLARDVSLDQLNELIGAVPVARLAVQGANVSAADRQENNTQLAVAALELARQVEALPALLIVRGSKPAVDSMRLTVAAGDVFAHAGRRGEYLDLVSTSQVQLEAHEDCRFLVFRERFGGLEHVAVVVGDAADWDVPLVRLHSSCLTGDLFGSLRCDCGEQLRGGIARIVADGGGVLLYLNQEGRGIGLANKLRAYALQDVGLDTVEANEHLGFGADQRVYSAACTMLQALGIERLRLLTNNPIKINALRAGGIEVVERAASPATPNRYNQRYLATKREKAGHLATSPVDNIPTC